MDHEEIRRQSWFKEALRAGIDEAELWLMAGLEPPDDDGAAVADDPALSQPPAPPRVNNDDDDLGPFGDDETRAQYRMMAIHEARQRIIQQKGFDPEAERNRARQQAKIDSKEGNGSAPLVLRPHNALPTLRIPTQPSSMGGNGPIRQPPSIPFPTAARDYFSPVREAEKEPHIQTGKIEDEELLAGKALEPFDTRIICLGCSKALWVSFRAGMVQCPMCKTASPATTSKKEEAAPGTTVSTEEEKEENV